MGDEASWPENWEKDFELFPETLAALARKGFASKRTLSKLTPEIISKEYYIGSTVTTYVGKGV